MTKDFTLSPRGLCERVNADKRLLESERPVTSALISRFREFRIIRPSLYKARVLRRILYCEEAAECVVLALRLARFRAATRSDIAIIFDTVIPAWFKDTYELTQFYDEGPDYGRFLRRLLDKGVSLPEHISVHVAPKAV